MEIVFTGLASLINGDLRIMGHSPVWMFPIYGCAVFLEPIHDAVSGWHWIARGLLWLALIWSIEYTSGLLLFAVLGVHPWLYTDPLAVNGFITLSFAPLWFAAGFLFERVHRTLDNYFGHRAVYK